MLAQLDISGQIKKPKIKQVHYIFFLLSVATGTVVVFKSNKYRKQALSSNLRPSSEQKAHNTYQ